jgi:soluble lytic murein transglycosylase-like protein
MAAPSRPPRRGRPRRGAPRVPPAELRRRRARAGLLLLLAVFAGAVGAALLLHSSGGDGGTAKAGGRDPRALLPGSQAGEGVDPLRYTAAVRANREAQAAAGLAHVLYVKSPGGAVVTAERVNALRPLVERAAAKGGVDPNVLEGIVFLESAGRPDAMANPRDLGGAAGLTQILAQTGTGLLGLKVDVGASERLTRGIARGRKVAARQAQRRKVDERFDPAKALAATARYLNIARKAFAGNADRDDLAVASYHMGIGNLQTALSRFGDKTVPYAELYFASSPVSHSRAYAFLTSLGDDSSTYLWRVRAAEDIMRRFRSDPIKLASRAVRMLHKASAEEVLRPEGSVPEFPDPFAVGRAEASGALRRLDPALLQRYGLQISTTMGELAPKVHQSRRLYRALRPEALATLLYLGATAQGISGAAPLIVTSTVRDRQYQAQLAATNIEATHAYSLHTTGFTFDILRKYVSGDQSKAFQFALDRLTAENVIAWVREPAAIHVTVGPGARVLLPLLRPGAPVPAPAVPATPAR